MREGRTERATAEALDGPEGDRGRADVDDGEDHRGEEGVRDGAGRGKESGRVVEAVRGEGRQQQRRLG